MERAFVNLIGNAIEAMPDGGEIDISAVRENGSVVVRVEDNGPGIPVSMQRRIFEPFERGEQTNGHSPGIGIGLGPDNKLFYLDNQQLLIDEMVRRIRAIRPELKVLYVTGHIDLLMDARPLWEGEAFLDTCRRIALFYIGKR